MQATPNEVIDPIRSSGQYRNDLVVSQIKLDNEDIQVLSRYGDSIWELPFTLFPSHHPPSNRKMNFNLLPECFQEITKASIYRYMKNGRDGFVKPRGGTIINNFYCFVCFFKYLSSQGITKLSSISPLLCMSYVNHRKKHKKTDGSQLLPKTLLLQFQALELLHELSQGTNDIMPHPWPDSSAKFLAGLTESYSKKGETKIIPENILTQLFNEAVAVLEKQESLLAIREQLSYIAKSNSHVSRDMISRKQTHWLRQQGYADSVRQQTKKCNELRSACMIIVLTLSGCRAHELAYINNGSVYSTQDDEGHHYFWMRSISTKTYAGKTEWMIPKLAKQALEAAELWAKPLQQKLKNQIAQQLIENPDCPKVQEQKQHQNALFLGCTHNRVSTLSGFAVNRLINQFAKAHNIDWHFTEHQFRRTFAVAVARSAYGDLRYLREHFKHWSLDMTTLYALNEKQEEQMYDEILVAIRNEKVAVVEHWLDDDALITGGGAEGIIEFRKNNSVKTYQDRKELANNVSELVHIRATGHGWCLADNGGCRGQGLIGI